MEPVGIPSRLVCPDAGAPGSSPYGSLRYLFEGFCHLLYPPRCRCCEAPLDRDDNVRICPRCWEQTEAIRGDLCPRCGHPLSDRNPERKGHCAACPQRPVHFDTARSAVRYAGAARSLIHDLKFRFHSLLAPELGRILVPLFEDRLRGQVDTLVSVPLHWWRLRWREFNQSELLALFLGERVALPVESQMLRRVRWTKPQSRTTGPSAKRRNVRGAFAIVDPARANGRRIVLIDDVYTSGSTVNECARILKEAGAASVHVLTVARVIAGE